MSPPRKGTPTNAIRAQRDLSSHCCLAFGGDSYRQSHKSRPLRVVTGSQSATALPPSCKLYARVFLKAITTRSFLFMHSPTRQLGHGFVLDFLLTSHCGNVTFIGLCLLFVLFSSLLLFFALVCFFFFAILCSLLKLFVSCLWHLSCYLFSLLCPLFHKAPCLPPRNPNLVGSSSIWICPGARLTHILQRFA